MVEVTTHGEAKEIIQKWLVGDGHSIKELEDDNTNFTFEIDYPAGQKSAQLIIQPKQISDQLVVSHTIAMGPYHQTALSKMKPKAHAAFVADLERGLLLQDNRVLLQFDEAEVLTSVLFQYVIYYDGLSKDSLMRGLEINYKTFLYVSRMLTDKFGGSTSTSTNIPGYG